jgi:methyl-accepting chemotaxis protein
VRLKKTLGGVFTNIISRNRHLISTSEQVAEQISRERRRYSECVSREMAEIELMLEKFAMDMTQYVEQLKSHTSVIEGLTEASHELAETTNEQNRFLTYLSELVEQPQVQAEQIIPRPEEEIEAKNIVFPVGCYRSQRLKDEDKQAFGVR